MLTGTRKNVGRFARCATVVTVGLASLSACSARMIDFTVISSKNVSLDGQQRGTQRVTGSVCTPVIVFPIGQPDLKTAVDRAIESAGPPYNALVDGVVNYQDKSFIFGKVCFEVTGTPIAIVSDRPSPKRGDEELDVVYHSSLGRTADYSRIRGASTAHFGN